MEETMEMLSIAYEDGIRSIIATPHFHPRRGKASRDKIEEQFQNTSEAVSKRFSDMKLYLGQEIYHCHDASDKIKSGEILTLHNSDYVLTEFSFTADVRKIKSGLNQLLMSGCHPILAHVERYEELVDNWFVLDELAEAGIYLQVNSESLLGNLGGNRKRFVKKLLKRDMVSFIATDAHDSKKRRPCLSKCAAYVERKFGKEMAERIFAENPKKVIENKMI